MRASVLQLTLSLTAWRSSRALASIAFPDFQHVHWPCCSAHIQCGKTSCVRAQTQRQLQRATMSSPFLLEGMFRWLYERWSRISSTLHLPVVRVDGIPEPKRTVKHISHIFVAVRIGSDEKKTKMVKASQDLVWKTLMDLYVILFSLDGKAYLIPANPSGHVSEQHYAVSVNIEVRRKIPIKSAICIGHARMTLGDIKTSLAGGTGAFSFYFASADPLIYFV